MPYDWRAWFISLFLIMLVVVLVSEILTGGKLSLEFVEWLRTPP
ncbi:MAG TPA: hypothetical protein VJJ48_00725 [Candidatus Paceibacterota bacterium]